MLFNSYIFMIFLPAVLFIYYGLRYLNRHEAAKLALFAASVIFYAYNHPAYSFLLLGSIACNYLLYRGMEAAGSSTLQRRYLRKGLLILGILLNLGVLFYFKYYDFFLENVNAVFRTDFNLRHILLPLGISFFSFQQLSFVIDAYRGEVKDYSLLDYSLYVSFFPQLVAGPIVLHKELIHQFADPVRHRVRLDYMTVGLRYFVMGLFKKVMVADRFGYIVSAGHVYPFQRDTVGTILVIVGYTLQIYFDFSGYSDMAIGLGKMFGFDIPVNFNSPYKSVTIADFWSRWHMTMTRFFTQYLYIPLGGSRKGLVRTCINVLIVFSVSGLWHGAAWNFVLWGLMHGIAQVLYRIFKKTADRIPKVLMAFGTFVFVNLAWVMFRAESLGQVVRIGKCLLAGGFSGNNTDLYMAFLGDAPKLLLENICYSAEWGSVLAVTVTLLGFALALAVVFWAPSTHEIAYREKVCRFEGVLWAVMLFVCLMSFANVSTFLYFNF